MKKTLTTLTLTLTTLTLTLVGPTAIISALKTAHSAYNQAWGLWLESAIWAVGGPTAIIAFLRRYFMWRNISLVAVRGGQEIGRKAIEPKKAQSMVGDEWERTLTLKGFASTFGWLNVDVLEISAWNPESRCWVVDFDKNPPSKPRGPSESEKVIIWFQDNAPEMLHMALVRVLETDNCMTCGKEKDEAPVAESDSEAAAVVG